MRDERERVQELVVRGTQRRWLAYLREAVELATRPRAPTSPTVARARAVVLDVVGNHHALLLGLPGRAAERTGRSGPGSLSPLDTLPGTETDDHDRVRRARAFSPAELDLRERARRFVDEVLIPHEELAERSGGQIPSELSADRPRGAWRPG